eukprot:TRINITY_DN12848_c0_g1_i1.p1 TRINITY_DN12848_c0_g1~~TRINITY_DN12848_c0_g1_i1.p1  ORF type:complete len:4801 (+),score=721.22 TRINITY_DN12848_c0_g1_i1:72-14474(+)
MKQRFLCLLLLCVRCIYGAPAVSANINEGGVGGVRSVGGAVITVAGADWNPASSTAGINVANALNTMTGQYTGACSPSPCPVPPVPTNWACAFKLPTASLPSQTVCTVQSGFFDIFAEVRYTLSPWADDGGNTWSTTTFNIYPTKGTAYLAQSFASMPPFPPQSQVISVPASGSYVGGTVTVPYLIYTEEDIRSGDVIEVALVGESWNDGTFKAAITGAAWPSEVTFNTIVNPSTPINPTGFEALKSVLFPPGSYTFSQRWQSFNDILTATLSPSVYDIPQHEVITLSVTDKAVTSNPPAGAPDTNTLRLEIWPINGHINISAASFTFTEDEVRSGAVVFDLVTTSDTWDVAVNWELVRSSINSDITPAQEPKGWQARRGVALPDPANIVVQSPNRLTVQLSPDPVYDISLLETLTIDLPGCPEYRMIRVLPVGTLCTPDYVMRSQLKPITSSIELRIVPSPGTLIVSPDFLTECDVRDGTTITMTLTDEYWNFDNVAAAKAKILDLLVSDVPTTARPVGEPAGFNALKSFLTSTANIAFDGTNTVATVRLGPSTAYDLSQNETLDLGDRIMNDAGAGILFRSGLHPAILNNASVTILPGPCHDTVVTMTCRNSGSCGGPCACIEFDEVDVRQGQAAITLSLPFGEEWADNNALQSDLWGIAWTSTSTLDTMPRNGAATDRSGGAAAVVDSSLPWGFLARLNASMDAPVNRLPRPFVQLNRLDSQRIVLTFSDMDYDIGTDETVTLMLPSSYTVSGVSPKPVSFTINYVRPTVTMLPPVIEVYNCDIQGPRHKYSTTPRGDGYSLVRTGVQCASTSTNLGNTASLVECAQKCHELVACQYFIFGTGTNFGSCLQESTSAETCPEGFVVDNFDFYAMSPSITIELSLEPGTWVVTGDDVHHMFQPRYSEFSSRLATILPEENMVFPSNNTLSLRFNADPTLTLPYGNELITLNIHQSMLACECTPVPAFFTFVVKRCPGVVYAEDFSFTEADIWDGSAVLSMRIEGDIWNATVGWDFKDWFYPSGIPRPTWDNSLDCVFKTLPTVASDVLSIPLGPCPTFDINTDDFGNLGVFALMDNATAFFSVNGDLTLSGVPPVGGNEAGFRATSPEGRVYFNLSSSQGTVRVTPLTPFFEDDVRAGLYSITLTLDPGETFANPYGINLRNYIRLRTRNKDPQPNGQGWEFLSSVLIDTVVIDPSDPHKMHITWKANSNYNIHQAEYLCIDINDQITASGLQPKAEDGSYCVSPPPVLPRSGCVTMEPYPYTVSEEEIRTRGVEFVLVLDNNEVWVPTGLDVLIDNMTVAGLTNNVLGWEGRKASYSAIAFSLDTTQTRLTVRMPGDVNGNAIGDTLFDIVESEVVEITVPETIVGSRKPPCVKTPQGGPLWFNITAIEGSVHMVETTFTESEIRTSGGSVVITIVGDTWASPWTLTEKEVLRSNLLTVCSYTTDPNDWGRLGRPYSSSTPRCNYLYGFERYRDDVYEPLINMTLLQYNNDKLEIVINPTPGYDIPEDEVIVIDLPAAITSTGNTPANWDKLWFTIKASKSMLANTGGVITPGITDQQIRDGTAPAVRVNLVYETWDITESTRFKAGFCGTGGDCNDVSNPLGFNALKDELFPVTVAYENELGQACPPNCPATVAVFRFNAVPSFDVCTGWDEEVMVALDPLSVASHPRTQPTPWGINSPDVLGFNITGGNGPGLSIKVERNLIPFGGPYLIDEELIRTGGLSVTLSVSDGSWEVANPNFIDMLRNSVLSTLPSTEVFSHAGPLLTELMPDSIDELFFYSDTSVPNRHMVFNISSPKYDIPSSTPKKCFTTSCPWLVPTTTVNVFECGDTTECNGITSSTGMGCCVGRQGIRRCPLNWPYMCNDQSCFGGYCCVDRPDACLTLGGLRSCGSPNCVLDETIRFNVAPEMTTCRLIPPTDLEVRIEGADWVNANWSTPETTFEATNYSTYVGEPVTILIEGTELHSLNDTAAISYTPGCKPGDPIYGNNLTLKAVTLPNRVSQNMRPEGPGLVAVTFSPQTHVPGIYDVCYKDFRDVEFERIPILGAGSTVYPVLTVIGKAFSLQGEFGGDAFNVTTDVKTRLELYGKGFCAGDSIVTNGAGRQSYGHNGVGCDSVKIMIGDVDCNPGYPQVDDLSGRFAAPVALEPRVGDVGGFPRSHGTVDFLLNTAGTYTVCYLSRWAIYWQSVGTFNVSAVINRWDACDPSTYDVTLYHKSMRDSFLSPSSNMQPPCEISYTALSGKAQRIFFQGKGLTSTGDQLGKRSRYRLYQLLGNGECRPTDPTFGQVTCQPLVFMTLWDCQKLCDTSAYCDGVQHNTGTGECVLQLMSDSYQLPNMNCVPGIHQNLGATRVRGSLRIASGPAGTRCFNRTDNMDPTDVGDRAKVIRHGDSCQYSDSPGPGTLSPSTPAIQYVDGDPYGADWDTTADTCTWHSSATRCYTRDTNVIWTFYNYGRYTLCYQFFGTDEWIQVPETHLVVNAEITMISPTRLVASQIPPVVWYIGRGIAYDIVEARMREWPATCDSPMQHPGVQGYGWEEDTVLQPGEFVVSPGQFEAIAQTNWSFEAVGSNSGGPPTAVLPHWWSMTGFYLFCYRIPGLTGWLPIDYLQVVPEATGVVPGGLEASPHPQQVSILGAGLDSRIGMDSIKFVPAVLGTCVVHEDTSDIFVSPRIEPRLTGIGSTGDGLRGLTVITATGQTFATPGLYRVCYAWQNETDLAQPRQCSAYSRCGAFVGNCCPTDNGVWRDCCNRVEPYDYTELTVGAPCTPTATYPPSWPPWYVNRISQCMLSADVPRRGLPWLNEPEPPCPDFFCGLLSIMPLVGGMIVEEHGTVSNPPVLEVGITYNIRFDGQGFSEDDALYIVSGFQSDCDAVDPLTTTTASMKAYPNTPGTPWNGVKKGLPRGLWTANFPDTGDFTVCLSFQFYPGLYIPAGNITVRNTIAEMKWEVDVSQNLQVHFNGGGLSPSQDRAMIIPAAYTQCNGTGQFVTNALTGSSVITTWGVSAPLANGIYHTCYLLAGTDTWVRLAGTIEVPFGNVQPAFDIIQTESIFGPPDNLHLYGPRGTGLNYSSPFAVGITTAKDGLSWLPREKNQTLQFKIISETYNKGDSSLFDSKCIAFHSHCFVTPLNGNETLCTQQPECEWVNSQCSAKTTSLCKQKRSSNSCTRAGCLWSKGQQPTFDTERGYLSFQIGDAEQTGSVTLEVALVDTGGTENGGNNVSESRLVSITITSGPEFTAVTPTVSLNEDEPQFDVAIIAWSVSRIQGREYSFNIIWDDPTASSFFAQFTMKDSGTLDAVPAPDRYILFPGMDFTVQLWDLTVGASFQLRFSVVIAPVNDPPYFEIMPSFLAEPIYWRQGRTDPFTQKVIIIPPSTELCRTLEGMMCIRTYVAMGCKGVLPSNLPYSCTPYQACISSKCTGVLSSPVQSQQCITPETQQCAVESVKNSCLDDINCKGCQSLACQSAPNSSFTLGRGEDFQALRAFSATPIPSGTVNFLSPPAVDIDGVLSFALQPSSVGTFQISLSVTDNGGNASGGNDTFSSPDLITVKTFFLPQLQVTPETGGIALETAFRMEAVGEESATNWKYTFTTLPGIQDLPVDLSKGKPISHSIHGPHTEKMIITSNLPAGDHTVVLHIYDGDTLVDIAQKFISVNNPSSVRLAEALQRGLTLASNKTQSEEVVPLLAAIGASVSSMPEAQTQGTSKALVTAIRDAVGNLQSPSGVIHSNAIITSLSSLHSAMVTTVDSSTLLIASDAYDNIKVKATGDGIVKGHVTLKGISLVGLSDAAKASLESSMLRDLAASYTVSEDWMAVQLTQTGDAVVANYTVAASTLGTETVQAILNAHNDQMIKTTTVEATYKALRQGTPTVWYEASSSAVSARGTLVLNGLDIDTLTQVKDTLLRDQLDADLADSFGTTIDKVHLSLAKLPTGESAVKFTVDTNSNPSVANVIKCAMIPACVANSVSLVRAPYTANLSRSTYAFDASGTLALPDLDFSVMPQDRSDDIKAAIRQDLAELYGVDVTAVTQIFSVDSRTGGTLAKHKIDMTGVNNPTTVQSALASKITSRSIQLTRAMNTLSSMTASVDYANSGTPALPGAVPTDEMMQFFVSTASAIISSAPQGPAVWNSTQDQDAALRSEPERGRVNYALRKQLDCLYKIIDVHCKELLKSVTTSRVDSRVLRSTTPAFTTEWRAVVGAAGGPLVTALPYGKGNVSLTSERPTSDTCLVSSVYAKSAFLSNGQPGVTPQLPIATIVGTGLRDTSVTLPISQSSDIAMIVWNKASLVWQAPRKGSLQVSSTDSTQGVMTWPSGTTTGRQAAILQTAQNNEERVLAVSLQPRENSNLCLACVLLPVLFGLWALLVISGLVLHERTLRLQVDLTDKEMLLHSFNREPTFTLMTFKHHAWLCYFFVRPTYVQYYSRAERATVWFSVYFIATGFVSFFFSSNKVQAWEQPPGVKYVDGIGIGFLCMLAGFLPSVGLRYFLTARERNWRAHVPGSIPEVFRDADLDDTGYANPKAQRPSSRLPYYFLHIVLVIVMVALFALLTDAYNTSNQIEQYVFAFCIAIAWHFVVEFLWVLLMWKFEILYWNAPDHPRRRLFEKEEKVVVVLPSFHTGEVPLKHAKTRPHPVQRLPPQPLDDVPLLEGDDDGAASLNDDEDDEDMRNRFAYPDIDVGPPAEKEGVDWDKIAANKPVNRRPNHTFDREVSVLPPSSTSPKSLRKTGFGFGSLSNQHRSSSKYSDPDKHPPLSSTPPLSNPLSYGRGRGISQGPAVEHSQGPIIAALMDHHIEGEAPKVDQNGTSPFSDSAPFLE